MTKGWSLVGVVGGRMGARAVTTSLYSCHPTVVHCPSVLLSGAYGFSFGNAVQTSACYINFGQAKLLSEDNPTFL